MSRFIKSPPKRDEPTAAEVRRAREFWVDVFEDSIVAQIDDDSHGRAVAAELVRFAGDVADEALKAFETRWGKV